MNTNPCKLFRYTITLSLTIASLTFAQYSGGSGSDTEPYLISSAVALYNIGQNPSDWSKHFRQTCNINMSGYDGTTPEKTYIPAGTDPDAIFNGNYNGGNFIIDGLTIDQTRYNLGLFGHVGWFGIIENVILENTDIQGSYFVAGIAGTNEGIISNCSVNSGNISGNCSVGGVCGNNGGLIEYCHSSSNLAGSDCGGICGTSGGTIDLCSSSGIIIGNTIGGICGSTIFDLYGSGSQGDYGGSISNSYSTAQISGNHAGGIAGQILKYGYAINCYYTGELSGNLAAGGIAASNVLFGDVSNSHCTGNITGTNYVGGIVGYNEMATVSDCYSTGPVNGSGNLGGICGCNTGSYDYEYIDGNIGCCFSTCPIIINGNNNVVGGVCGDNNANVVGCYSDCIISVDGQNNTVGGLIGKNACCTNSYSQSQLTVHGNYNTIGGFTGSTYGHLEFCYSTGKVTYSGEYLNVGGFCGLMSNHLASCFWDVETSMIGTPGSSNFGAIGKTTSQMQDIGTFLIAGWDFVEESANGSEDWWTMNGYPKLSWQRFIDTDVFSLFAKYWLKMDCSLDQPCSTIDLYTDGIVNINDLAILATYWLNYDPIYTHPEI